MRVKQLLLDIQETLITKHLLPKGYRAEWSKDSWFWRVKKLDKRWVLANRPDLIRFIKE